MRIVQGTSDCKWYRLIAGCALLMLARNCSLICTGTLTELSTWRVHGIFNFIWLIPHTKRAYHSVVLEETWESCRVLWLEQVTHVETVQVNAHSCALARTSYELRERSSKHMFTRVPGFEQMAPSIFFTNWYHRWVFLVACTSMVFSSEIFMEWHCIQPNM